ncbi:colicin E3/pyocin S6 family cytotoxin [Proteus vulgaris]|uniref:colicin E3/pyocin S6 family cytotoxin n=1 Tax=Proteus vulgaris TaxID=585 RepID=UPI0030811398
MKILKDWVFLNLSKVKHLNKEEQVNAIAGKGDKGRRIYEWDSQYGELEGYRASDGQHIGVFDPKTGNQLKPADPRRNIKKYL